MTEIRFYLHEQSGADARLDLACRLLQKAWHQQLNVYVYTKDEASARQLDEVLWIFKPQAFIPHCLHSQDEDMTASIRIGHLAPPQQGKNETKHALLFNLSDQIPDFYENFTKMFELIPADEPLLRMGRERWQAYKKAGHGLTSDRISYASDGHFRLPQTPEPSSTKSLNPGQ